MTLSAKLRVAYAVWFIAGFGLGIAAIKVSSYFIWPLIILQILVGLYAMSLRCPHCGKRALITPVDIGVKVPFVTSWVPNKCARCGQKIS